jgi:AbrB family looped-hinge helix DNA binding protein
MKQQTPIDKFKFYGAATIGTKGQIVIPAEAREELSLNETDKVIILRAPHGDGIMVLKAEIFEVVLAQMQSQLTSVTASLKKNKEKK